MSRTQPYLFITIFLLTAARLSASPQPDHLFSLDLSYTRIGLSNNGWGLGIAYEKQLRDHIALKGSFGHMTFQTSVEDLYCTTVNLALLAHVYPLSASMEKLYIGSGCSTDFLNYFGPAAVPDHKNDTIIYLDSLIGWKLFFRRHFLIDIHTGYNFIINGADNYPDFQKYGQGGFQSALSLKYLF